MKFNRHNILEILNNSDLASKSILALEFKVAEVSWHVEKNSMFMMSQIVFVVV